MAAELQRLALGLADHVHQAAQRLDRELADRSRCGIHFRWKGRDLDRRRLARAGQRRDRGRLLEQAGMAAVEQLHEICTAGLGPRSSTRERLEVLRNWNSALAPSTAAEAAARRTGSPPGGSILRTSAPRSAAILAASDVASLRQSGTPASFTSTMVKRCKGRESVVIAR